MTTNKPEVVAWRWRRPTVNDEGETVALTGWVLSETPEFLPWWTNEPLIRLSDHEARTERMAEALEGALPRLHAAAPELLEALQNMVRLYYSEDQQDAPGQYARAAVAAIAKATGEEQ